MARIDDYQQARDLAAQKLARDTINAIVDRSGFKMVSDTCFTLTFLGHGYEICIPGFEFKDIGDPSKRIPLQEQVLILHYLLKCQPRLENRWIAYREIPGAGFYFGAFVKRAVDPLKKVFGNNAEALRKAASALNATPVETGNAGFEFSPLPYTPIQLILWEGDEEFPAEANILFDASVGTYLAPEDAAWLASLLVYRLIFLAR